MNDRQQKRFEERYGEKKFVCIDGDEATYEWKDRYEAYSAACQDEAKAVRGLVEALEKVVAAHHAEMKSLIDAVVAGSGTMNGCPMIDAVESASAALKAWKGE